MTAAAIWAVLRGLPWKYIAIAIGIVSAALLIWRAPWAEHRQHAKDAVVIAARDGTIANMKAASDKAAADNKAHVAAVQTADEQTRKEQTDALSTKLVDARATVDRWMRAQAASRHTGGNPVSQAADPTGPTDGAGEAAIVPVADLQICAENTVKAQGWQDWYKAVSATPR